MTVLTLYFLAFPLHIHHRHVCWVMLTFLYKYFSPSLKKKPLKDRQATRPFFLLLNTDTDRENVITVIKSCKVHACTCFLCMNVRIFRSSYCPAWLATTFQNTHLPHHHLHRQSRHTTTTIISSREQSSGEKLLIFFPEISISFPHPKKNRQTFQRTSSSSSSGNETQNSILFPYRISHLTKPKYNMMLSVEALCLENSIRVRLYDTIIVIIIISYID